MNLKLWKKREKLAEIIFDICLIIAVSLTFLYDVIPHEKTVFFIVIGLLEASLFVLLILSIISLITLYLNKYKINFERILLLTVYFTMFVSFGYYFNFIYLI